MASTNPREWMFQGWIAFRIPWPVDHSSVVRFGNALLSRFPNMQTVVRDEMQGMISFGEHREGLLRAEVALTATNVSFRLAQLERVEEWRSFNLPALELLRENTNIFDAKFNIMQARQSVYIPIREVTDPGKRLFALLGNPVFLQNIAAQKVCSEIGVDQEFAFPVAESDSVKLILRVQTPGPTATWLISNQILITLSAVVDPRPAIVDNIPVHWQQAQDSLLGWLSDWIHPAVIGPLLKGLE